MIYIYIYHILFILYIYIIYTQRLNNAKWLQGDWKTLAAGNAHGAQVAHTDPYCGI